MVYTNIKKVKQINKNINIKIIIKKTYMYIKQHNKNQENAIKQTQPNIKTNNEQQQQKTNKQTQSGKRMEEIRTQKQ